MVKEKKDSKEKVTVKEEKKAVKKTPEKKQKKVKEKPVTTFKTELSRIKWPSKKDMVKYSIATIIFVIFFALFFFGIIVLMSFLKEII